MMVANGPGMQRFSLIVMGASVVVVVLVSTWLGSWVLTEMVTTSVTVLYRQLVIDP